MHYTKFKLELEDIGVDWDQAEKVVDLAMDYVGSEMQGRIDKGNERLDEILYEAEGGVGAAESLEGLLHDLETFTEPVEGETVEDLQRALKEYLRMLAEDQAAVRDHLKNILDRAKGEL